MYAIRSYYDDPDLLAFGQDHLGLGRPVFQPDLIPHQLDDLGLGGGPYPALDFVITSYSIHYTKLYETGQLLGEQGFEAFGTGCKKISHG